MARSLTIMKLGGSLLTDKKTPYTTRNDVVVSVAQEIKECIEAGLIEDLILVHGVGSHGHPPVLEHKLHYGFQGPEQLIPMSKTQQAVNKFRMQIAEEFTNQGIPINLMHTSSMCIASKMQLQDFFLESLEGFMSIGMVPLLGGDMVCDKVMGFSVGSGDQLTAYMAKKFAATRVVFATDVKGISSADPKKNPDAQTIPEITTAMLHEIIQNTDVSALKDASGAMKGKLQAILSLIDEIKKGTEVDIISMLDYGNLKSLLSKKDEKNYTKFVP